MNPSEYKAVAALADALDSATGGDRSWQWCVAEARRILAILAPLLAEENLPRIGKAGRA